MSRASEAAVIPLSGLSALAFAALSAVRRRRVFHPYGRAFEGVARFPQDNELPFRGTQRALIRFSRGVGLPDALPDVLGLALKLPDLEQDLLLATSGEDAVTRHLLLFTRGFFRRPYSSVLAYDFRGRTIVFGARADPSLLDLPDQDLGALPALVATGKLRFELTWGRAGTDEVETFGTLVVERPHDGELLFNPFFTHPGLRPAGALNRLRLEAYRRSQEARPDAHGTAPVTAGSRGR